MWKAAAAWGCGLAVLGAIDAHLNRRHDGSTLSEATRLIFHTNTPTGRAAFTATLAAGAVAFHHHICKQEATWAPSPMR